MKRDIILITVIAMILAIVSPIMAQETVYLSYQGQLNDNAGNPLDTTVSMTFSIYDNTGYTAAIWSMEYPAVEVSNGLFSLNLGPIPDTIFDGNDRYLGIKIGADAEISPRTLLTSAPSAAYAKRMAGGDVETGEGSLTVNTESGDSAIVLDAGQTRGVPNISMYATPPDPCKVVEINAGVGDATGGGINLYNEISKYMGVEPMPFNTGGKFQMFNTAGGLPTLFLELSAGDAAGAGISLHDEIGKRMGVEPSPFHAAYGLTLYNPEIDPAAPYVELLVGTADGAIMNFHNDIGKVMGFDPTPFHDGYRMTLYNPSAGPDAVYFQLGANPTDGASMDIYDDIGKVMGFDPSPFNQGYSIKLLDPAVGPSPFTLMNLASSYGARASAVTMQMYNPSASAPASPVAELTANESGGYLRLGQARELSDATTIFYGSAEAAVANFTLKGNASIVDNMGPVIMMVADATEAKMGIGMADSDEALYVVGNIVATGNITALTDTKAKTNVEPITDALDIVENLHGVRYDWNDEFAQKTNMEPTRQIGLIAQEVEEVLPEIVLSPENGYKSVDYSRITAVLIEAVKELKTQNEELQRRVEQLESRR